MTSRTRFPSTNRLAAKRSLRGQRQLPAVSALIRGAIFDVLALVVVVSTSPAAAQSVSAVAVPRPSAVIGFEPGTDRRLPTWHQVVDYFTQLDAASPRVTVRTLGRTTLGRPFIAAFIT